EGKAIGLAKPRMDST
nr:RecName: Full=65 kDa cell wall protein [Solanum lycopersicum]